MAWHLAPSLVQLRDEINTRWPRRPKGSDGTIGDSAHAARQSDHNPNGRGSVNAIDITYPGVNPTVIISAVKNHPAANYVIFNGSIYRRNGGWKKEVYHGASPHKEHLHISILQTVEAEQSKRPWLAGVAVKPIKPSSTFPLPASHAFGKNASSTVHNGKRNSEDAADVKKIQKKFKSVPDTGFYGPITERAVKLWQVKRLMRPTGRVGKREWNRLGL
jgi:peptidoglycan hydrolase-like protein with peptidoglycan-binding domain